MLLMNGVCFSWNFVLQTLVFQNAPGPNISFMESCWFLMQRCLTDQRSRALKAGLCSQSRAILRSWYYHLLPMDLFPQWNVPVGWNKGCTFWQNAPFLGSSGCESRHLAWNNFRSLNCFPLSHLVLSVNAAEGKHTFTFSGQMSEQQHSWDSPRGLFFPPILNELNIFVIAFIYPLHEMFFISNNTLCVTTLYISLKKKKICLGTD